MLTLLAIVLAAILAVLVYAASKPDTFRYQRAIRIQAPPEKIFPLINEFAQWTHWSPWEHIDPTMKRSYSGPASGKGAGYAWEGAGKVGAGGMEITESAAPGKVLIKLDFIKPFEAHNVAEFTLVPAGGTTEVTWAMYGPSPYISKLMGTFFNMDKMIGKDFEAGLANMKAQAEK